MRYAGLLVVSVLVAEVVAAVTVAAATSWGATVLLLVGLSTIGTVLVRRELSTVVRSRRRADPRSPLEAADALADTAVRIGGSLLVVVPGFVTGAFGLLLLFPPVRVAVRRWVGPHWARRLGPVLGRASAFRRGGPAAPGGDREHVVIDGALDDPTAPGRVDLGKRPGRT